MNRPFLSTALIVVFFACTALTGPSQDQARGGKQTAMAAPALVIPIDSAATTIGGIEGTVLRVTTLAADGPGSLRRALEDPRPRLVVTCGFSDDGCAKTTAVQITIPASQAGLAIVWRSIGKPYFSVNRTSGV